MHIRRPHLPALLLAGLAVGCASTSRTDVVTPKSTVTCPVTGRPIEGEPAVAYYGTYEILCVDRPAANQFGALPAKKRARLAGPQVLAAQGIGNETCPLTGKPLDGDAVSVRHEGCVDGFASLADANQFMSLPKKKQAAMLAAVRTEKPLPSAAAAN